MRKNLARLAPIRIRAAGRDMVVAVMVVASDHTRSSREKCNFDSGCGSASSVVYSMLKITIGYTPPPAPGPKTPAETVQFTTAAREARDVHVGWFHST